MKSHRTTGGPLLSCWPHDFVNLIQVGCNTSSVCFLEHILRTHSFSASLLWKSHFIICCQRSWNQWLPFSAVLPVYGHCLQLCYVASLNKSGPLRMSPQQGKHVTCQHKIFLGGTDKMHTQAVSVHFSGWRSLLFCVCSTPQRLHVVCKNSMYSTWAVVSYA